MTKTIQALEEIRGILESDLGCILELNDAEVQQTSAMDRDRLGALLAMSSYARVVIVENQMAAFVIALREYAPYENDNHRWFASRYPNFLYVDRIVVDSRFAGRGLGSKLYSDLFTHARLHGIGTISCEYNLVPPNPASRVFHDKFGFKQVGTQWLANGTKQVSLQVAQV